MYIVEHKENLIELRGTKVSLFLFENEPFAIQGENGTLFRIDKSRIDITEKAKRLILPRCKGPVATCLDEKFCEQLEKVDLYSESFQKNYVEVFRKTYKDEDFGLVTENISADLLDYAVDGFCWELKDCQNDSGFDARFLVVVYADKDKDN